MELNLIFIDHFFVVVFLFVSKVDHIPSRKKGNKSYSYCMLFYITDVSLREAVKAIIILNI